MTSYGSLCRGRALSKLSFSAVGRRLARPAVARGVQQMATGSMRALSSVPPRHTEATSTQRVILQTQTSSNQPKEAAKAPAESLESSSHQMRTSPVTLTYTGGATMPVTTQLKIVTPEEDPPRGIWPVYRLMVCQFFFCHRLSANSLSHITILFRHLAWCTHLRFG